MVKKRKSKFNKRIKTPKEKIKLFVVGFATIGIIVIMAWGVIKVMESSFLKAKITWEMNDTPSITQTTLEKSIQSLTYDKYQFDIDKIKEILQSHPWVTKAQITNKWLSNDIQIQVIPQQIAMRWENIDCKAKAKVENCRGYISNNSELFNPKKIIKSKAPLARSKAKPELIAQLYRDYQQYQNQAGEMTIKLFSKTHIDKLIFEPDVHVILGYQQKQKRLSRFLRAYKKLQDKNIKLESSSFDMRYPKGFSLKYH